MLSNAGKYGVNRSL